MEKKMDRRKFLKASVTGGAVFAAGSTIFSLLNSRGFAKGPEEPSKPRPENGGKTTSSSREMGGQPLTGRTMEKVSSHISTIQKVQPPAQVLNKAKHHVMDTIAAMVSGSKLRPGQLAAEFVRAQKGVEEAQIVGTRIITSAINAAMANGMMAHADETDDSHERSLTHPGAAVIPAALAVSDRIEASGETFLKGVIAGYDVGCRITQALGVEQLDGKYHSTHCFGGNFGAAAAAASVLGLRQDQIRMVLSYTGQQASGVTYWKRDPEHVEKAFVFGGMPARNGVTAALFVQSGFTGVSDVFSGESNFLAAFSPHPQPEKLTDGLGDHYEIMQTNIKRFAIGSPIQAPLDAVLLIRAKHHLKPQDVERIAVHLPPGPTAGGRVVDNRNMPDVNLQYILAVGLLDGDLSFEAAHSYKRMNDPEVVRLRQMVSVVLDSTINTTETTRQAVVYVTTKSGTVLKEHVLHVRGTASNPMTNDEVEKKCIDLFESVLGRERSLRLVEKLWNLEKVRSMREFRPLLTAGS